MKHVARNTVTCSITAVLLLAGCGNSQTELPEASIVSTTLCADGYLHALPEIESRLAALSWQSRSALSRTPEHLKVLPQTDDNLERRLQWKTSLQVSSAGGRGDIDLKWGEDFESVWDNFSLLSSQLKTPNPTDLLKARLNAISHPENSPRILYVDRSGATAGPGTFVDAVIRAAGGENVISNPGWQSPDVEMLISLQPDVIVTSFMNSDYAGVNDRAFRHASLATKLESLPNIHIPGKYWPCAGPGLIDAAEILSQGMSDL